MVDGACGTGGRQRIDVIYNFTFGTRRRALRAVTCQALAALSQGNMAASNLRVDVPEHDRTRGQ